VVATASEVDWNTLFQSLPSHALRDANEEQCRQRSLFHLGHGFVSAAKTYGKIIISELSVPVSRKTIKPIDVGGIAGGMPLRCPCMQRNAMQSGGQLVAHSSELD
jgi:hypothetical protein